jgi:hypothetical protein
MPSRNITFLYSGINPETGEKATDRIDAASLHAAKQQLEADGWREIVFHSDALAAATSDLFKNKERPELTAEHELRIRNKGHVSAYVAYFVNNWAVHLVLVVLLFWQISRHQYTSVLAFIAYIGLALSLLLFLTMRKRLTAYDELMAAVEWGRWQDVRQIAERLKVNGSGVPEWELDRRLAQSMAAEGRIEDAIASLAKYNFDDSVNPMLRLLALRSIYDTAKNKEKVLELAQRMVELQPTEGALYVDMAFEIIRLKRDATAARDWIVKAQQFPLVDMAASHLHFVEGAIALEDGKGGEACERFENAIAAVDKMPPGPLLTGLRLLYRSYLCLACAAVGDKARADMLLASTRSYLIANREDELLERCEAAVSPPT